MVILKYDSTNQERINRIKATMAINDHTKAKLAELLGISKTAILQKLAGKRPWQVIELEALADIYDVNRSYFF